MAYGMQMYWSRPFSTKQLFLWLEMKTTACPSSSLHAKEQWATGGSASSAPQDTDQEGQGDEGQSQKATESSASS